MGANQDANWCVSYPWFDWILGTRERTPAMATTPGLKPASVPRAAPTAPDSTYEPEAAE
jgi:hypothetical protein